MKVGRYIFGVAVLGAFGVCGVLSADHLVDPYEDKGTYYRLEMQSEVQGGEHVRIHKDKAQFDLVGWGAEYTISVTPQIPSNKLGGTDGDFQVKAERPLLSKRIEYTAGPVTTFVEPKQGTDNRFDVDFTLNADPGTNIFTYKIAGAEEFDFLYQSQSYCDNPEIECPDDVIGSYAIYHKEKGDNCPNCGTSNYGAGKIAHIYRPKAIDDAGNETWAVLNYAGGLLTVEVPQAFLDSATYPVTVDPTLGFTTIGGSNSNLCTSAPVYSRQGDPSTTSGGGTLTSISVALSLNLGGPETLDVRVFVNQEFSVSATSHGQIATAETTDLSVTTTTTWYTINLASEVINANTSYIMNITCDGSDLTSGNVRLHRDSGSQGYFETFASYGAAAESPWTDNSDLFGPKSIYATYVGFLTPTMIINGNVIINGQVIIP